MACETAKKMSSFSALEYIITHVFLPPKLPQEDDSDPKQDLTLIKQCRAALSSFQERLPDRERCRWVAPISMLTKMLELRDTFGDMVPQRVESSLQAMEITDVLAFHIRKQNAGIIIRRLPQQFSFESFELSPTTEAVMTTKGRLLRCFPGPAVAVTQDRLINPHFREALTQLLAELDANTPEEAWPVVEKAKSKTPEIRDSLHPKFITEMLTGILRGIGQPVEATRIHKRTRDDVLWNNVLKPWRRSPLWLLLRVALQTSLRTNEDDPHRRYKSFMIFFMTHIMQQSLQASLESDTLFLMAAKINRRILKLGTGNQAPWMPYVHQTIQAVHLKLAERWKTIEGLDPLGTQRTWKPSELSFYRDTQLTISTLRPYLAGIATREIIPSGHGSFTSGCHPRIKQSSSNLPRFQLPVADSTHLSLTDLELWVQDWLDDWLRANLNSQSTCTCLADLIENYTKVATSTYEGNPEDTSVMLLTSMDLWVALDKCATRNESLLSRYDPGFPPSLFTPLLLPKKSQMKRLARIEQYLTQRKNGSVGSSLIFRDINVEGSFGVQYFGQSQRHQDLRREIEAAAEVERDKKKRELRQQYQRYNDLKQQSKDMSCEYSTYRDGRRQISIHDSNCQKCRVRDSAESLEIGVHEWPLPIGEMEARSAVFELDVPITIAKWRDTTYTLLVDVLSPLILSNSQQGTKIYYLHRFGGLSGFVRSQTGRLQFASVAKPFVVAHYGTKKIPQATEENICVHHGSHYSMHDSTLLQWTAKLVDLCDIRELCTFQLLSGDYRKLQYALNVTTHTSNEVLANQAECPKGLNLHEFYAFATLRSGNRLQWRNIARELVARILNFNREETYMLVVQAAWQAGSSGDGHYLRESHIDLDEEEFGSHLLSVLGEALGTVEGNWQGAIALRTFVALATRLLSVSACTVVHTGCYLFLRRARQVTLKWTRDVGQLLHEARDVEELKALNLRVLEMALTCHSTFGVDKDHLFMLLNSEEDIAVVTECSIIVHDRYPAVTERLPRAVKTMLERHEKLCYLLEPILSQKILAERGGIDSTLRRVWAGYHPGRPWATVESPSERWLVTETSTQGGFSRMIVHYNILDGSLLINGLPLTRLPRPYELHSTYRRLFDEKVLEVIPSTMTGMVFETRKEVCGQQIHFRMCGPELIIRTYRLEQVCELLPTHTLRDDFPAAFIQDYVHWLDVDTGVVEWRPLRDALTSSPDNWRMRADGQEVVLSRGAKRLIDVRSPTANAIAQILGPLENTNYIHMILDCRTEALEVNLPRMRLDFSLRNHGNLLLSKQFRGMVVDECQSFGALTGLVNKLVLRGAETSSRSVIVPHGHVSFAQGGHHVRVTIDTASAAHVKYHSYHIDSQLGRLVDNGNLRSRLFRLYLHATTAHCLVDQLTGRTGTEEALYGLTSAATRSFVKLELEDAEILGMLARLTPRRQYYPEHLRVMQQVDWGTLSPLSQHRAFSAQVASIFNQAKSFYMFQEQPVELPISDTRGEDDLLERAAIRDSSFQTYGFGAEVYTTDHDVEYSSRDQVIDCARELRTCRTAKLVDDWSTNLTICPQLLSEIESWNKPILGPGLVDNLILGFDPKWLDLPANFLPDHWCTLHSILSGSVIEKDKYKILIFLSTLSYSQYADQELVQTLLALATIPELRILQPPNCSVFPLGDGYVPEQKKLAEVTDKHVRPFHECPESSMPSLPFERQHIANQRRRAEYALAREEKIQRFVRDLKAQWPQANISAPPDPNHGIYILVDEATESARVWFQKWHCNDRFQRYVLEVQSTLNLLAPKPQNLEKYSFSLPDARYVSTRAYINFEDLARNPAPCLPTAYQGDFDGSIVQSDKDNTHHIKLEGLLTHVSSQCSSKHEQQYASDLFKSFEALREDTSVELNLVQGLAGLLEAHLMLAKRYVKTVYEMICSQLQLGRDLVQEAQMLPRLSQTTILSHLASDKVAALTDEWKKSLVVYGLAIVALQRAERLIASYGNAAELLSELENPGHQDWDPMRHPEWLLLEIENNIQIRREQAQIAGEMMSPSSGCNSVMQLNMGLGKSSVIVPIAATALADRTQLVRVVVLKPLAMQMFHLLAKKLGGMLNRRIFYMPISRSLKLDVAQARKITELYKECMRAGGILLIQPEHILSFELMGFEQVLSGKPELGNILIQIQDWLQVNSRDILDESDEILSVRFELVYTMGIQRAIEFSPNRWAIIQHVLGLLGCYAPQVQERFAHGLEVVPAQPGGFPRIRILQTLAGDELLEIVARQLCQAGLPGVPVSYLPPKVRVVLFKFLTDPKFSATAMQSLQEATFDSDTVWNGLLLLRGLFAGGILRFAMEQKRWRVNYGLDHSRTMLAVPYYAKDSPATRAEFSHPDATITLTCLSYYYGGLSDHQIYASFEALLQSDHAPEEYARWVQDAPELPPTFKQVTGINLRNAGQCSREVFPSLRFARGLINFYMSNIVFPAEMKEFPHKLSSSGWDIAREKTHPTTGFSGTNDTRYILPLSITQGDLPPQLSTNAKVLDCLLRSENSFADVVQVSDTGALNADVLLRMALVLDPPIRVILDVGAQVLELGNKEMARAWLLKSTAQAVIFFDNSNEICVLSRDGTMEALLISPFAKQMDQCLVYLDEVHTRGTDLGMPANYRAIVTLGPGLTKDRLVQACMRMRKLGKGQSIVFCASMEVQRKILECRDENRGVIEVTDVLKWCIANTMVYTRKCIPLWATQGVRRQRRHKAYSQSWGTTEGDFPRHLAESLLEKEAQSLQERYGVKRTQPEEFVLLENTVQEPFVMREKQLADIRTKCQEFEVASFSTAALQEEQERELSPENEREQQVELPPASRHCEHSVHPDVQRLIRHGILKRSSNAFRPAFRTLRNTSAFDYCEITAWPDDLLVTADFAQTIEASADELLDSFLRPVHWLVSCKKGDRLELVVLSPHEAQELLPSIRQYKHVILHVYSPRLSVSVRTLEDLSFCAVPAVPAVPESWATPTIVKQLNLFAGQLYIRNHEEYESLCSFLGLCSELPDDHMEVACDGFITPPNRSQLDAVIAPACPFTTSPVDFLRVFIALRRKGQSFTASHFGRILNGELISKEHFESEQLNM